MTNQPTISFDEATTDDVAWIVPRLRQADVDECEALFGAGSALECVQYGLHPGAYAFTMRRDGEVVAIFGVCRSVVAGVGTPWMVGTDKLDLCWRALVEDARFFVQVFLEAYPVLLNVVDARNAKSIRWLKRLGFKVNAPEPMGLAGELFHVFEFNATS